MRLRVVVLAGGDGRRLGGNKLAVKLGGRPLIEHALRSARQWDDQPMLALRGGQAADVAGVVAVSDPPGLAGPVAGLAAGAASVRDSEVTHLLLIPVDTPFLPADLPQRLGMAIAGARCAIARSGGRDHPACSLWQVDGLEAAIAAHAGPAAGPGRGSLIGLAEALGTSRADWPPSGSRDPFANLNTPADLAAAEAALKAHPGRS